MMDNSKPVTLSSLINEGKEIKTLISYVPAPRGVLRMYSDYSISDLPRYEVWKNLVIRFLSANYPGDRCIDDFEAKLKDFSKHYSPSYFDGLIGILESCIAIPVLPKQERALSVDKSVHVNVNQSQNQSQSQEQNQVIDLFLEAIKDEITGKQLKELKSIAQEEPNPEKAKSKILDKVKSWGEGISASIVANIITNPTIWAGLM